MAKKRTIEPRQPEQEDVARPDLPRTWVLALWLAVTAAIVPGMWFVVRAEREVSQYSTLTFESSAREALAAGDAARVVRVCTGALRSGIDRTDYWGKAQLLRAQGYAAQGKTEQAIADLETCAREWARSYYVPSDADRKEIRTAGTDLGIKLLEAGNVEAARRAISAAGTGSGKPVEYLYEEAVALSETQRKALWPEGPCIALEDFRGSRPPAFEAYLNEQGRKIADARVDPAGGMQQGPCAAFSLSEAAKDGASWFGVPVYVPIAKQPFGVRVRYKSDPAVKTGIVAGYWFNAARRSDKSVETAAKDLGNGWKVCAIERYFAAEQAAIAQKAGFDPSDGIINRVSLSPARGPAVRYWVDSVEVYLPAR